MCGVGSEQGGVGTIFLPHRVAQSNKHSQSTATSHVVAIIVIVIFIVIVILTEKKKKGKNSKIKFSSEK